MVAIGGCLLVICAWAVSGLPQSIPVLLYHQIDGVTQSVLSVSTAQFTEQMDLLVSLGYKTISPWQYAEWVQGRDLSLPAKPILITFDDNIISAGAAIPILLARQFRAVMYVATGFADFPGGWNMDWTQLQALLASDWYIQLHAGPSGHAALSQSNCPYFYGCRLSGEDEATYQARVRSDIDSGLAALNQRLGVKESPTFAVPWDYWGQGSTDPAVNWAPQYFSAKFSVVFHQVWGYRPSLNRRYRYELGTTSTVQQLQAALSSPQFALPRPGTSSAGAFAPSALGALALIAMVVLFF
jgi:hypothetical protein